MTVENSPLLTRAAFGQKLFAIFLPKSEAKLHIHWRRYSLAKHASFLTARCRFHNHGRSLLIAYVRRIPSPLPNTATLFTLSCTSQRWDSTTQIFPATGRGSDQVNFFMTSPI